MATGDLAGQIVEVEYQGSTYRWNGKNVFRLRDGTIPPISILAHVNKLLDEELERQDALIDDLDVLLDRAKAARDARQLRRAERLVRQVLGEQRESVGAATVLCSVLRDMGDPGAAIRDTQALRNRGYPPLLTSRAAALLDLKKYDEAKAEIDYALAASGKDPAGELWAVRQRWMKETKRR